MVHLKILHPGVLAKGLCFMINVWSVTWIGLTNSISACISDQGSKGNYKTWTLEWTGLWTGLNYGPTKKMLKLFSVAFYNVVSVTKCM